MVERGFSEAERDVVGALYWEAFGPKLRIAFSSEHVGAGEVTSALQSERVLVARSEHSVLGMCGFYDSAAGAVDLTWSVLRRRLGVLGASWALLALAPLSRSPSPGTLVLDGICVAATSRGRGVGTALLAAAEDHARSSGATRVQLSVISTNPRARSLYLRRGYQVVGEDTLGPLRHLYGFASYATMHKEVRA
ncbi:GNAT family N-acetyltransferase [Ruania rhizosphaerae]|uniref:GNAT family N-acetyltransferase n=1 Tax=Ruania rhizosphaerae TaxID=1840413 RepID=UPI00190F7D11|nr:GNAT family N-acetyltransferase [Ruania rhizosphaerae]